MPESRIKMRVLNTQAQTHEAVIERVFSGVVEDIFSCVVP